MMLNEVEDTEETLRNVDNTKSITNTDGCNVAIKSPRKPSLEERLASKMLSYPRETICFFIGIVFTFTFATLHITPPRISRPPTAGPFFNQNSLIIDFYKGQVGAMIERASDSDVSFVMYYAPWDAESQIVRNEFEIVAEQYHTQVFFAAINCWHPGSECRAQYNKIQSYPVLVMYPLRGSGVQYRGINRAQYMMRFLEGFLKPMTRISTREELSQLQAEAESVIVGFFNFEGLAKCPGYKEFHRAAIRSLEKDPNRDTIFALVTDSQTSAKEFNIEQFPSASLYLWNESLIYPSDNMWTSENLVHWMDASLHKVALWLQPPGIKSLTLAPYLQDGPVLFLFTPRNPLHRSNYNYNLIREVALQYYNCDDNIWTNKIVKLLEEERRAAPEKYLSKIKNCSVILSSVNKHRNIVPVSIPIQRWINDSCCAKIFMNKCLPCKSSASISENICSIEKSQLQKICNQKDIFKIENNGDNLKRHFCCDGYPHKIGVHQNTLLEKRKLELSMLSGENDYRSPIAIQKLSIREECQKFLSGSKFFRSRFLENSTDSSDIKFTASACSANRSLAFIAIDSLHYYHFAEGLGIDLSKIKGKTSVVIVDSLQESQYLMPKNLSRNSLVELLNNYSNGSLRRTLRSDSSRRYARDFQTSPKCDNKNPSEICIPELTTETFLKTVLDPKKDVVVLYYSPYCAFCSAVSFVYLTIAQYLSKMNDIIFVRIDGDNNDLPWEYSMNRYPSILFFPSKRKEDSMVYPFSLPITIPNLLNFVLANLESDSHVEALINVCHIGAGESSRDCVIRIRRLCLNIIHNLLKKYRKLGRNMTSLTKSDFSKKKQKLLVELDLIRDIHLILSSVDDLAEGREYQIIINKFRTYHSKLKKIDERCCEKKNHKSNKNQEKSKIIKNEL